MTGQRVTLGAQPGPWTWTWSSHMAAQPNVKRGERDTVALAARHCWGQGDSDGESWELGQVEYYCVRVSGHIPEF